MSMHSFMNVYGKANKQRRMAFEYMRSGLQRGESLTHIVNLIRDAGLGYRRKQMFSDIHDLRDSLQDSEKMRFTNKNKVISADRYIPSTRVKGAKFETIVKYKGINRKTGESLEGYMTIKGLHEYNGHMVMDIFQSYTPNDLGNAVKLIFDKNYDIDFQAESIIPVYGFQNSDI